MCSMGASCSVFPGHKHITKTTMPKENVSPRVSFQNQNISPGLQYQNQYRHTRERVKGPHRRTIAGKEAEAYLPKAVL